MTQAEINGQITAAIAADQLAALKEYFAAAEEVRTGGPNAGNLDIIAKSAA